MLPTKRKKQEPIKPQTNIARPPRVNDIPLQELERDDDFGEYDDDDDYDDEAQPVAPEQSAEELKEQTRNLER